MPFRLGHVARIGGLARYLATQQTYCQTNESANDYGKCYNTVLKAIFVQSDTSKYPRLPCENDGTCIRFTTTAFERTLDTIADYSGIGKQLILKKISSTSHSSYVLDARVHPFFGGLPLVIVDNQISTYYLLHKPFTLLQQTSPCVYSVIHNALYCYNRYTIPNGFVQEFQMDNTIMGQKISLEVYEDARNNIYYAYAVDTYYMYETSPIAIIPLDYNEYSKYQELRKIFGYNYNCVDQPGWNAHDMIRILSEIFPDRVWMVFDDSDLTLYTYGITLEQLPDWIIAKLNPASLMILKEPWDSSLVEMFISELNARNHVRSQE